MIDTLKNELLVLDVINMLTVDDFSFLHGLDSVLLLGVSLQPADLDVTKGTYGIQKQYYY
jgi:hypothetical protein